MNLLLNILEGLEIRKTNVIDWLFLKKDLAELALNGLRSHTNEKLEGYKFLTLTKCCEELWLKKAEVNVNLIVLACMR